MKNIAPYMTVHKEPVIPIISNAPINCDNICFPGPYGTCGHMHAHTISVKHSTLGCVADQHWQLQAAVAETFKGAMQDAYCLCRPYE